MMSSSDTKVYGVIGDPIHHSKSPLMMNEAFKVLKINAAYYAFHVTEEHLPAAIKGIKALQLGGVNVTIPHKETVIRYLDELDESAQWIGAVNTIVHRDGKLIGYNTDGLGYVRSLIEESGQSIAGKNVIVLGAGGAARGIVYALCKQNVDRVIVANRTVSRAEQLATDFSSFGEVKGIATESLAEVIQAADIVINTTSLGMAPHLNTTPMEAHLLQPGQVASDIVYTPWTTRFLREASERGCHLHRGLGMFIYQGALAFEHWTGEQAPVKQMRAIVQRSLTTE